MTDYTVVYLLNVAVADAQIIFLCDHFLISHRQWYRDYSWQYENVRNYKSCIQNLPKVKLHIMEHKMACYHYANKYLALDNLHALLVNEGINMIFIMLVKVKIILTFLPTK